MVNLVPSFALDLTSILPPCALATSQAMYRPILNHSLGMSATKLIEQLAAKARHVLRHRLDRHTGADAARENLPFGQNRTHIRDNKIWQTHAPTLRHFLGGGGLLRSATHLTDPFRLPTPSRLPGARFSGGFKQSTVYVKPPALLPNKTTSLMQSDRGGITDARTGDKLHFCGGIACDTRLHNAQAEPLLPRIEWD
jgi:hypothetical protein